MLDYNPERGIFTWREDRRPRVKAGDPAGGTNLNGYYTVTLEGRAYNALPLALYYATGEWPEGRVYPKDGDRGNAAWDNIGQDHVRQSTTKQAVYMRGFRERQRAERKDSPIEGIQWSEERHLWTVRLPGRPIQVVDGHAKTFEAAVRLYYERVNSAARVDHLPPPPITTEMRGLACDVKHPLGGIGALTLAELHEHYCYDPETGFLLMRKSLYRTPRKNARLDVKPVDPEFAKGLRADQPGYAGTRVLRYDGRDYPVHMIAAFFVLGHWTPPRYVRFANGDQTNPAWNNLLFNGKPDNFRFWSPRDRVSLATAPDRRRKPQD